MVRVVARGTMLADVSDCFHTTPCGGAGAGADSVSTRRANPLAAARDAAAERLSPSTLGTVVVRGAVSAAAMVSVTTERARNGVPPSGDSSTTVPGGYWSSVRATMRTM